MNEITVEVVFNPMSIYDAEMQTREWFEDQDEYMYHEIDSITVSHEESEKYDVEIVDVPNCGYVLEAKGAYGPSWEEHKRGTKDECLEFVRKFPGTGQNCRIRQVDDLFVVEEISMGTVLGWEVIAMGDIPSLDAISNHLHGRNFRIRKCDECLVFYTLNTAAIIEATITATKY
jgi:hypothetical protein